MQNNQTYSEIFSLISTKEDLLAMQEDLSLLEKSFFESGVNGFNSIIKTKVNQKLALNILNSMSTLGKEEVVKNIQTELSKIKTIEVTLSEIPTQNIVIKISSWLKREIKQKVALDIKIDPQIIAGATISLDGKYFDGSLKLVLNNVLKKYV